MFQECKMCSKYLTHPLHTSYTSHPAAAQSVCTYEVGFTP